MRTLASTLIALFVAAATLSAAPDVAHAQQGATAKAFSVRVLVKDADGKAISGAPVLLRAARPKGPFEPKDPKPQREWAGLSDANGVATFADIPDALTASGLRIHAVTTHGGVSFKSAASIPAPNVSIDLPVYEKTFDVGVVSAKQVRTVIEPWEGYLVFSQFWTLNVKGKAALDTSLLSDPKYERGLPIELPLKAQGIQVIGSSSGTDATVVNSSVFLQGILKPGQPVTVQLRYSIPVKTERYVYTQRVDYPTDQFDVLVALNTDYDKLPYIEGLELRSFDMEPGQRSDIPGLRTDRDFVIAIARGVTPGKEVSFQLRGLPFTKPIGPWIALALGLLGAGLVLGLASAARKRDATSTSKDALKRMLLAELSEVLDMLADLEDDFDEGVVSSRDYEFEATKLRSRAALLIKKLDEMGVHDIPSQARA